MKSRLLVLAVLALTACMAPGPQARIKISTGERVVVGLRDGRVEGFQSDVVKVLAARLMLNAQNKNGVYDLGLLFVDGAQPASILVEDVSDEKPVLVLRDDKPVLNQRIWHKTSEPVDLMSDSMKWMHDIDDSFRVYDFHITLQDGRKIRVLQASIYLGFFKSAMMQTINPDKNKP
ncbi:MAG: hypothetical protein QM715_16045 [Nibricoccus sp.]